MEHQYDKSAILDIVRGREGKLSRNGSGMAMGLFMVRAAEAFVRSPCLKSLNAFTVLEEDWRALQPKAHRRYANDFRLSLGLPAPAPLGLRCSTPHNKNWNPARGYVYGFWSLDHPGLIKLGATIQPPADRLFRFKQDYDLNHLEIAFFFEVQKPRLVELDWTQTSRTYRCSMSRHDSREWYTLTPAEAKRHVLEAIERAAVKRLSVSYVSKDIDRWQEIGFWPQGPKRINGCICARAYG